MPVDYNQYLNYCASFGNHFAQSLEQSLAIVNLLIPSWPCPAEVQPVDDNVNRFRTLEHTDHAYSNVL